MLKIRLSRTGRKNYPSYRIVITESSHKRDGKFVEIIGHYKPTNDHAKEELGPEDQLEVDEERWSHWRKQGAQPSEGVKKLIQKANLNLD